MLIRRRKLIIKELRQEDSVNEASSEYILRERISFPLMSQAAS